MRAKRLHRRRAKSPPPNFITGMSAQARRDLPGDPERRASDAVAKRLCSAGGICGVVALSVCMGNAHANADAPEGRPLLIEAMQLLSH